MSLSCVPLNAVRFNITQIGEYTITAPAYELLPMERLVLPPIDWVDEGKALQQKASDTYDSLPPEAQALLDRAYELWFEEQVLKDLRLRRFRW